MCVPNQHTYPKYKLTHDLIGSPPHRHDLATHSFAADAIPLSACFVDGDSDLLLAVDVVSECAVHLYDLESASASSSSSPAVRPDRSFSYRHPAVGERWGQRWRHKRELLNLGGGCLFFKAREGLGVITAEEKEEDEDDEEEEDLEMEMSLRQPSSRFEEIYY